MLVAKTVAWPQESILGGLTKQHISYDQLSLTQFTQGFLRNILDEPDQGAREFMLWYFMDLMEDATDFSWANVKAAHAVLLCEMERGMVTWQDTNRIEHICHAHSQKYSKPRQNWDKFHDSVSNKTPLFCKPF